MLSKGPRLFATLLAVAGLALSITLEVVHVRTYLVPSADSFCAVGEQLDCRTVALSRFSVIGGVPLPIWGIAGFLALAIAALRGSRLLLWLSAFASVAAILLLAEEIFAVGSVCLLCEGVHVLALGLFGMAVVLRASLAAPTRRDVLLTSLPALALLLASRLLVPQYWQATTWQAGVPFPTGTTEDGHPWVGAENPIVTVEEFVDYGCPHCALQANRMRMILARHADELRVVRRQQPRHWCRVESACVAVRAAICAGEQGKFWEMDTWLFLHAPGKAVVEPLPGAQAIALDVAAFETCLADPSTMAAAEALRKASSREGVVSTPMYVVDGKKLDSVEVHALLDDLL